jgi:lipopolysaccharide transport system permease protein
MNQVAIQKLFFPLLIVTQDFVKQIVVFIAMLGFLLVMGVELHLNWLALPAVVFTQALLILAVGMVCAGIVPLVPDFKFLIGTLLTVLMWGSGIFYSYQDVLLKRHQELFLMNPMANLIKNYRQVLLDGQAPDWLSLALICAFSLLLIAIMIYVFRKLDTTYARLALQ